MLFMHVSISLKVYRFSQDMSLIDRLLPLALVTTITGSWELFLHFSPYF